MKCLLHQKEENSRPHNSGDKFVPGKPLCQLYIQKRYCLNSCKKRQASETDSHRLLVILKSDQRIKDMPAVKLANRHQVKRSKKETQPACKQKRVVIHLVHRRHILEKACQETIEQSISDNNRANAFGCFRSFIGECSRLLNMIDYGFMP